MAITIKVKNIEAIAQRLRKQSEQAEKAIKATANDMRNRVPGWVATEVTGTYNIKKSEVMPAKKGKNGKVKKTVGNIAARGVTVNSVQIVYQGRVLTPVHFGMKPKKLTPGAKGRKRKPITAEIKKGQRKALHSDAFLGSNKGGGYIPFKRSGAKRYPIESIKTLSLPQMVENEAVYEKIQKVINTELSKRLEHNVKRFIK